MFLIPAQVLDPLLGIELIAHPVDPTLLDVAHAHDQRSLDRSHIETIRVALSDLRDGLQGDTPL